VALSSSFTHKFIATVQPVAAQIASSAQEKVIGGYKAWRNAPNDVPVKQKIQAVLGEMAK